MNISFKDIGTELITVKAQGNLRPGNLCCFSGDKTCSPASTGSAFSGKVISVSDDGTAVVQIRGYIEVAFTDNLQQPTVNYQNLVCAGPNSVRLNENGKSYLVVSQNLQTKTFGIML